MLPSSAKSRSVSLSCRHLISYVGSPSDYLMAEFTTSRGKKENYSLQAGLCKGMLKEQFKEFSVPNHRIVFVRLYPLISYTIQYISHHY